MAPVEGSSVTGSAEDDERVYTLRLTDSDRRTIVMNLGGMRSISGKPIAAMVKLRDALRIDSGDKR